MTKEEKLEKITQNFSMLSEEKQDYILGVLQALIFAHKRENKQEENVICESEIKTEPDLII